MARFSIDGMDSGQARLEDIDTGAVITVPVSSLPQECGPGDILIEDEGRYLSDGQTAAERKKQAKSLFDQLRES